MIDIEIFTYNIAWLRRYYGFTKKKMAELLKISIWCLNQIEKGKVPPRLTIEILFAVQRQFGISPSVLFRKPFADDKDFL